MSKHTQILLFPIVLLSVLSLAACSDNQSVSTKVTENSVEFEVFKQASCGCCGKWIDHMEQAGFDVKPRHRINLTAIKKEFGVPKRYQSCHTAISGGYVFEGHIPPSVIQKFLEEKPEGAVGLLVPGMPIGSPGMEAGDRIDPYDVLMLKEDGSTEVYAHIEDVDA